MSSPELEAIVQGLIALECPGWATPAAQLVGIAIAAIFGFICGLMWSALKR